MRVLIADKLVAEAAQALQDAGHEVHVDPALHGEALREALSTLAPEVLVVRSTKVTAEHLAAASALSLVVRAGAGVNTIDLDAAGAQGVFVSNCPGRNADAVAELTLGLLVSIDRRIPDNVAEARAGRWDKKRFGKADGLKGRTLGVLGCGRIGQAVIARAQAFGMEVVAWSRSLDEAKAAGLGVRHAGSPVEVARHSDALTVHTALTPDTRGLIGAEVLDALPDGAIVLNTSRAGVVDADALSEALDRKGLRVGLDVFEGEPATKQGALDTPLARHERVYLTHHIGASTAQAQQAVAAEAVRVITVFHTTGTPPNCVNVARAPEADHSLVVRHRDRVGVLAAVLDELRKAELNVQEMDNTIFAGGEAAIARIQIDGDPSDVTGAVSALPHVLHVAVVPLSPR